MNDKTWLTLLRGFAEKYIDEGLTDEYLHSIRSMFEATAKQLYVKNIDDAIFGYIVGDFHSKFQVFVLMSHNRQPTKQELNEGRNAIVNRMSEIKNRILETNT